MEFNQHLFFFSISLIFKQNINQLFFKLVKTRMLFSDNPLNNVITIFFNLKKHLK